MDGRKKRYVKDVLDRSGEEHAGDLRRSELNDLEHDMSQRFRGQIWKRETCWKSNQNIVMNEEFVKNFVMNEEFVKNIVMNEEFVKNIGMNAKIDPKVVLEHSIFKICGWNNFHPSNQILLEEFMDESEPWLLICKHYAQPTHTSHARTREFFSCGARLESSSQVSCVSHRNTSFLTCSTACRMRFRCCFFHN